MIFDMEKVTLLAIVFLTIFSGCKDEPVEQQPVEQTPAPVVEVDVPDFNEDSAYYYVAKQVEFGPRVPGTPEHAATAEWLRQKLAEFIGSENVIVQEGQVTLFNNQSVTAKNIIATINPEIKNNRIILAAHWDTRMFADHDDERKNEPILGANDGGSGVGVLLEIARIIQNHPINNIGIDIILFDVEDQGVPDNMGFRKTGESAYTWCLGSQYWSRNQHNPDFSYQYGILLDMVGAKNAIFPQEGYSRNFAPRVVKMVWEQAQRLGFGNYFVNINGSELIDDHYFVNTIAQIPMIDIIHYNPVNGRFWENWHTHEDDLSAIDKNTLNAVGTTVLHVIYKENAYAPVAAH